MKMITKTNMKIKILFYSYINNKTIIFNIKKTKHYYKCFNVFSSKLLFKCENDNYDNVLLELSKFFKTDIIDLYHCYWIKSKKYNCVVKWSSICPSNHSFLYVYNKKIDEYGWSLWNNCPNKIKKAVEEISV